jgi:hypothetical protein
MDLNARVFVTVHNREILELVFDRFETHFLSGNADNEYRTIAVKTLATRTLK